MQVKNDSLRLWTVREIKCIPGEITEVPDAYAADVVGHAELKVVEEKAEAKKPGRPAKEKAEDAKPAE
jgi:hypothetical protein